MNATVTVNNAQPLFFKIQGRVNAASETHYPGFYATYVTTNAPHGTYYTALNFQQNAGFDAENGANWSIDPTNETFRAWGGNSNTFEVMVPMIVRSNLSAASFTGDGSALTNLPPSGFAGGATFYSGSTNIGNLSTSQVVLIGHTMPNTNYTPAVMWTASSGAPAVIPAVLVRTTTSFTIGVSAGITGGDTFLWSVIYSP